jgi:serine protease Do
MIHSKIQSIGISFIAGLAGAALWTTFLTKPESPAPSTAVRNLPSQFTSLSSAGMGLPPESFVEASQSSTGSVVFIKNFSSQITVATACLITFLALLPANR